MAQNPGGGQGLTSLCLTEKFPQLESDVRLVHGSRSFDSISKCLQYLYSVLPG